MMALLRRLSMMSLILVPGLCAVSACGSDGPEDGGIGGDGPGGDGPGGAAPSGGRAGTGGDASGGKATGGDASGGKATGGAATGGNPGAGGDPGTAGAAGAGTGLECGNGQRENGEFCDSALDACCADDCQGPRPKGQVCRPSADGCEPEEACTGASAACPTDKLACVELALPPEVSANVEGSNASGCKVYSASCLPEGSLGGKEVTVSYVAPLAGNYTFIAQGEIPLALSHRPTLACDSEELGCTMGAEQAELTLVLAKDESVQLVVEPSIDAVTPLLIAVRPAAPSAWTCDALAYGDGLCHCGCAAPDVDCDGPLPGACDVNACEPSAPSKTENTQCGEVPPSGWTCSALAYVDGVCDCGCGRGDPACPSGESGSCEVNRCSPGLTPGSLQNERCDGVPWACDVDRLGDGRCDCGCGAVDSDCTGAAPSCDETECTLPAMPDPNHAGICTTGWTCDSALLGDGECDCGCGAFDTDCESPSTTNCDYTSCETGNPLPSNNAVCGEPSETPPAAWSCDPLAYGDAVCDCGCDAPDPDCASTELTACQRVNCGPLPLAGDPTQCQVPPNRWYCEVLDYYDGVCDCGCGTGDPACESSATDACGTHACGAGAPAANDNARCTDVPDAWQCPQDAYGDGLCDCGCGAQDSDCASLNVADCEQEICGEADIVADNNATCEGVPDAWTCLPQLYYDDVCDCGCGTLDPDCSGETPVCERSACGYPQEIDPANAAACVDP